jgi:hypothetical protein
LGIGKDVADRGAVLAANPRHPPPDLIDVI